MKIPNNNNKSIEQIRLVDDYDTAKYRNYLTTVKHQQQQQQTTIKINNDYPMEKPIGNDNDGHLWPNVCDDGKKYPKIRALIFWMQRSSSSSSLSSSEHDLNKILEKQLKIFIYRFGNDGDGVDNNHRSQQQQQQENVGQVWLEKIKHSKSNCLSTYHYRYRFVIENSNNNGEENPIDIQIKFYLIRWPDCYESKSEFFLEEFGRKYFSRTNIAIAFYSNGNLDSFQYATSWLKGFYQYHRQQQKQQQRQLKQQRSSSSSSIIVDNHHVQIYLARFGHCIIENDNSNIDLNEKDFIKNYHVRIIDCGHHHNHHNRGRRSSTTSITSTKSSTSSIFSRTSSKQSSSSSSSLSLSSTQCCCKKNCCCLLESFLRRLIKVNLDHYFNLHLLSVSIQAERQQEQMKFEKNIIIMVIIIIHT
ncbi:hypothetical protein DERP_008708 [Dermatophagoides pteronyssinus]|uniref:Uncharacterized protein n=1 Tax=Dermatophagoides pteronyssinus TaxID=6956 RepID=A0ABQ8IW08_DERPT|nr:hypothetical protein DERP_008708 [Dermatophagoides pteronyssinus]